jgi:poly(A) polymerase
MIGDPATRYREDPVRIIRAVRFAAKLSAGLQARAKTAKPLVSRSRCCRSAAKPLFDEMLKLLQTGHALASVEQLKKLGWRAASTRCWTWWWSAPTSPSCRPPCRTPTAAWRRQAVAPSFLLACVLWQDVRGLGAAPGAASTPSLRCRTPSTRCSTAHRRCLGPRQAGRRHARDLGHAAAL